MTDKTHPYTRVMPFAQRRKEAEAMLARSQSGMSQRAIADEFGYEQPTVAVRIAWVRDYPEQPTQSQALKLINANRKRRA